MGSCSNFSNSGLRLFPLYFLVLRNGPTQPNSNWHRAGELGNAESYYNIGNCYMNSDRVQRDMNKARHYWELAAMRGHEVSRYNLGIFEEREGSMERALKHYMISVGVGCSKSLERIREFFMQLFMNGHATKEDYGKALQSYQSYLDEIRSNQRDEAATLGNELWKYY